MFFFAKRLHTHNIFITFAAIFLRGNNISFDIYIIKSTLLLISKH